MLEAVDDRVELREEGEQKQAFEGCSLYLTFSLLSLTLDPVFHGGGDFPMHT